MTDEEKYIAEFKKKFKLYSDRKIALYGLGTGSKWIIDNCKEYDIAGLMDGYLVDGSMYGMNIISYDEAEKLGVNMIIIIARSNIVELIRRRISGFCLKNGILLMSQYGKLLDLEVVYTDMDGLTFDIRKRILDTEFDKIFFSSQASSVCDVLIRELEKKGKQIFVGTYDKKDRGLFVDYNITEQSDGEREFIRLASSNELHKVSSYGKIIEKSGNYYQDYMRKLFIDKAFASPFVLDGTDGRLHITSPKDIGYLFMGPIVATFVHWMLDEVKKDNIDIIFFAARDGYLIEKIFKMYAEYKKQPVKTFYLLTSRLACIAASMYDTNDITEASEIPFSGSSEEMMIKRFLLHEINVDTQKENEKFINYVSRHEEKILKRSQELRECYTNYIYDEVGYISSKKVAFFDFVSSGTCQKYLNKMLDIEMTGYYFYKFLSNDPKKKILGIKSLFKNEGILAANSLLMESVLTSFDATFKYVDNTKTCFFAKEKRTKKELEYVESVQKGIFQFCKDYLGCIKIEDTIGQIGEPKYAERYLELLYGRYTVIENEVFKNYVVDDELHGQFLNVNNIYKY